MGSPVVFKGTKALILPQDGLEFKASQRFWLRGSGTPEGVVTALTGSFYIDESNGNFYTKNSGAGNTGWAVIGLGALMYQSGWDASSNTPAISDATGLKGQYYVVTVAGTQNLGSGAIDFTVSDLVIHNGTVFEKVDNADTLQDVYNKSGSPEILTDAVRGAITVRGGTGTDTDSNFETQDNAGTLSSAIQADGAAFFGAGGLLPSAVFQANSTTRGQLAPRMTTVQRDAIAAPATSLYIFNTTTNRFEFWNGAAWEIWGPLDYVNQTRNLYVSFIDGSDVTGDGSLLKPFQTITPALALVTGNTVIFIGTGTYTENLTIPAGGFAIALVAQDKQNVTVIGKYTQNLGGYVTIKDIRFENTAAEIFEFGGAVNQSLDIINCNCILQAGSTTPLFLASNSAGSGVNLSSSDFQVTDSTGGSKVIVQTGDTNFNVFKVTVGIQDNQDNICLDFSGTGGGWSHQFGAIGGQMVFSGGASLNFSVMGVQTNSVPNLVTTTSGFVLCGNASFTTSANPCVTGTGSFNYLLAAKFGAGDFAATLNGGAGAIPFPMDGSDNIMYNNTVSGLTATNVKTAIDELSLLKGVAISVNQAAHGFTLGEAVYQDAAGVWQLGIADINAPLTAAQGIVTNVSVNDFIVVREGRVTVTAHGLTPIGDYFYLDQTSAGVLTGTQPTTGLQVLMGKIVDANTLDVGPVITSLATNFNPLGSYMRRTDGTVHGTVATTTLRFLAAAESSGTDITYVPDAANGDKFVINTTGIYSVSNYQYVNSAARSVGISVGTLNIGVARSLSTTMGHASCAWTGLINAGEEVWILNDATDADMIGASLNQITIARLA